MSKEERAARAKAVDEERGIELQSVDGSSGDEGNEVSESSESGGSSRKSSSAEVPLVPLKPARKFRAGDPRGDYCYNWGHCAR